MGKTSNLFKQIRDTKGAFHAKMGLIKDRNGLDLQKQKILRRGGKNTQNNYTKKKNLNGPDNHHGVINQCDQTLEQQDQTSQS